MAPQRKTVDVAAVLELANTYLASEHSTPEKRLGVASLTEMILHATGNYAGFNYLGWVNGGVDRWRADGEPADNTSYIGDQTRRVFYYAPGIQKR